MTCRLTWFDFDGNELGPVGEPALFWFSLDIAPDGKRAAAEIRHTDGKSDLLDVRPGARARQPLLLWDQGSASGGELSLVAVDGGDGREPLVSSPANEFWGRFSPDGKFPTARGWFT